MILKYYQIHLDTLYSSYFITRITHTHIQIRNVCLCLNICVVFFFIIVVFSVFLSQYHPGLIHCNWLIDLLNFIFSSGPSLYFLFPPLLKKVDGFLHSGILMVLTPQSGLTCHSDPSDLSSLQLDS